MNTVNDPSYIILTILRNLNVAFADGLIPRKIKLQIILELINAK